MTSSFGGEAMIVGRPTRRAVLAGAAALAPVSAFAQRRQAPARDEAGPPPIVFVHGNGDSAAVWINNFWRFESNGFDRRHLFAIDFPYPLARTDDSKPHPLRSSTAD